MTAKKAAATRRQFREWGSTEETSKPKIKKVSRFHGCRSFVRGVMSRYAITCHAYNKIKTVTMGGGMPEFKKIRDRLSLARARARTRTDGDLFQLAAHCPPLKSLASVPIDANVRLPICPHARAGVHALFRHIRRSCSPPSARSYF